MTEKFVESAWNIIIQGGKCTGVPCDECPASSNHNGDYCCRNEFFKGEHGSPEFIKAMQDFVTKHKKKENDCVTSATINEMQGIIDAMRVEIEELKEVLNEACAPVENKDHVMNVRVDECGDLVVSVGDVCVLYIERGGHLFVDGLMDDAIEYWVEEGCKCSDTSVVWRGKEYNIKGGVLSNDEPLSGIYNFNCMQPATCCTDSNVERYEWCNTPIVN